MTDERRLDTAFVRNSSRERVATTTVMEGDVAVHGMPYLPLRPTLAIREQVPGLATCERS